MGFDTSESLYMFTPPTVADTPKFELESYIDNYSVEAFREAVAWAKEGKDVGAYKAATDALSRVTGENKGAIEDSQWIDQKTRENAIEIDRLEHELKGYKNNLIKESIRMGQEELAEHFYQIGDLAECARTYNRMREYCTTASHVKGMLLRCMIVAIDRQHWVDLHTTITRLRNIDTRRPDARLEAAMLAAVQGLYYMQTGQYKTAASQFLSTDPVLARELDYVISLNDVATYGTLCALATLDRNTIQAQILDNALFRAIIETEPHLRRAVKYFCASKFQQCQEILEAYKVDYLLDMHLSSHVERLYEMIRLRAMQQYILPFSVLTVDSLESVFSGSAASKKDATGNQAFEDELLELIRSGNLDARLDLENKTLVRPEMDERSMAYHDTLQHAQKFIEEAHLELLYMNMVYAELEVRGAVSIADPRAELPGGDDH